MSNQQLEPKCGPAGADSRLAWLVDHWVAQLSGSQFKIAAYLYRRLEQAGGKGVHLPAHELADAAGVGDRVVETAHKALAANGIIPRFKVNRRGAWYEFPEGAAATPNQWSAEIAEPEGESELSCSAEIAEPEIQAAASAGLADVDKTKSPPEEAVPDSATITPAIAMTSMTATGSAKSAEPKADPELIAASPWSSPSRIPAAAIISVLQNVQSRLLQALRNYKIGAELIAAEEPLAPRVCPSTPTAEAAEPRSAAAEPEMRAPATLDDTFAA
jgi:hypothetical protein